MGTTTPSGIAALPQDHARRAATRGGTAACRRQATSGHRNGSRIRASGLLRSRPGGADDSLSPAETDRATQAALARAITKHSTRRLTAAGESSLDRCIGALIGDQGCDSVSALIAPLKKGRGANDGEARVQASGFCSRSQQILVHTEWFLIQILVKISSARGNAVVWVP